METEVDRHIEALGRHSEVAEVEAIRQHDGGCKTLKVVPAPHVRAASFGLFYFSDQDNSGNDDSYRLCIDGAVKADELGLDAVWLPERHFTGVGAASPNPSVLCSALAMVTRRVALRAGSVVLPLHHPIRVAEEWAMVDQLSGGRAGVSFASGWVPDDFVFAPEQYTARREVMAEAIQKVQALWAGKAIEFKNGIGQVSPVAIRPRPKRGTLPIWVTAVTASDTFALAGRLGANVLTALLQMSVEQLADNIRIYREERAAAGLDPKTGNVTVMLHTYLLPDAVTAETEARPALRSYFMAQTALRHAAAKSAGKRVGDNPHISDRMLDYSVDKFVRERCLIGSPSSVQPMVNRMTEIGADEFACLIDFGIASERVLDGIGCIAELKHLPYRRLEQELNSIIAMIPDSDCVVRVVPRVL